MRYKNLYRIFLNVSLLTRKILTAPYFWKWLYDTKRNSKNDRNVERLIMSFACREKKRVNRKEARKVVWLGLPIWLYKEPISAREARAQHEDIFPGCTPSDRWASPGNCVCVCICVCANAIRLRLFLSLCLVLPPDTHDYREKSMSFEIIVAQFL